MDEGETCRKEGGKEGGKEGIGECEELEKGSGEFLLGGVGFGVGTGPGGKGGWNE